LDHFNVLYLGVWLFRPFAGSPPSLLALWLVRALVLSPPHLGRFAPLNTDNSTLSFRQFMHDDENKRLCECL